MKILIVSHNAFSRTNNMGKTLRSYFSGFDKCELAQLYIHTNSPDFEVCENYYRVTDGDMLRSLLTRKSGGVVKKSDLADTEESEITGGAYRKGKRRTPLVFLMRNLLWRLGAWRTKGLLAWVDEFDPDLVFFASGDYSFTYDIALSIARYKDVPLAVACVDDFYLYNRNEKRPLGRAVHRSFMRAVGRTMSYASLILTICDRMAQDYGRLFGKPTCVLHTSASLDEPLSREGKGRISYIGNLSLGRDKQLTDIGRALASLDIAGAPKHIDVYSTETDERILSNMTEENGIRFHGALSADGVLAAMGESLAVIHTESFDDAYKRRVAYSVSTKLADSLASGSCIFAYGPRGIASMDYLSDNGAAVCVFNRSELAEGLTLLLSNGEGRNEIIANALALAGKNHTRAVNGVLLKKRLEELITQ